MTKLTQEQLEAIRKRAEAATEGPWQYVADDNVLVTLDKDHCYAIEVAEEFSHRNDGEFCASAREDVPKLVEALLQERAEVERLRSALQEIADIDDWDYGLEKAKNITFKAINMPEGWA